MRAMMFVAITAVALAGATTARAGGHTAYAAIAAGDLIDAERTLTTERRIFPDRPELMLNLAAVYGQTGRDMAAASLYRAVLSQPAVAMDMPSGTTRSSHAIARSALGRIAPAMLATR